jgi:hypothetical protein
MPSKGIRPRGATQGLCSSLAVCASTSKTPAAGAFDADFERKSNALRIGAGSLSPPRLLAAPLLRRLSRCVPKGGADEIERWTRACGATMSKGKGMPRLCRILNR